MDSISKANEVVIIYFIKLVRKCIFRSGHRRNSVGKGVLRDFAKFTGKHLCQSLFFNKDQQLFLKRHSDTRVLQNTFWIPFEYEHLSYRTTHSDCFCILKILSSQVDYFFFFNEFTDALTKPEFRWQKQPSIGVLRTRCSKNMQQIYRRTFMPMCDFNKVALHGCSPVNFLHIFRTLFCKNTTGGLLLRWANN